jgi:hypothetical protein
VRFVWPAQRYDRLTRKAAGLSVAITTVLAAALSLPIAAIYRGSNGDAASPVAARPEVITFVAPPATSTTRASQPHAREVVRSHPPQNEKVLNDTGSTRPARLEAGGKGAEAASSSPAVAPATPQVVGPVATPVGIRRPPVIGAPPPPWEWLPPTQAERDSTAREQERRMAEARDQHRPVAVPLSGASIGVPFLSRGPSREQRARDSVINADNIARLARLAARARAKQDSILAASMLAGTRADSVRRPRPEIPPNE